VELGEVESALASHPALKEAAVLTRETGAGERRLVAYWVPTDEHADGPDAAALRAHLKALLPEYMVPSAYVRLERLPLTANGKLDRRALPDPEAPSAAAPVEPRTVTERMIAEIWMEVLGVENVGVEDDFFVLGGHSLKATQVLARISDRLEVELRLRVLFETPTVAGLAAAVEAVIDGALTELEGLSEEEVAALLAEVGEEG
jgi:nonribosomal peptide synthetase DhbF